MLKKQTNIGCDQDITCDGVLLSREGQQRRTFPHKEGLQTLILVVGSLYFIQEALSFYFNKLTLEHDPKIKSVRCSIFLC